MTLDQFRNMAVVGRKLAMGHFQNLASRVRSPLQPIKRDIARQSFLVRKVPEAGLPEVLSFDELHADCTTYLTSLTPKQLTEA